MSTECHSLSFVVLVTLLGVIILVFRVEEVITIVYAVLTGPRVIARIKRQKHAFIQLRGLVITTWRSSNVVEHGVNDVFWQVRYKIRGDAFARIDLVLHKGHHQVAIGTDAFFKFRGPNKLVTWV